MVRTAKPMAAGSSDDTRPDDDVATDLWDRLVDEGEERTDLRSTPPTKPVSPEREPPDTTAGEVVVSTAPPITSPDPDRAPDAAEPQERAGRPVTVLRLPRLSPSALVLGWVLAWGAIAIVTPTLVRSGVETGFNLGIAEGGMGDSGFEAGLALLIVSGAAFMLGGYGAARMARVHGTKHGVGVVVVAMAATGVDAVVEAIRDGTQGVVRLIPGIPFWGETGMADSGETALVFAIFAVASLVGGAVGGALGQAVNRATRTASERHG